MKTAVGGTRCGRLILVVAVLALLAPGLAEARSSESAGSGLLAEVSSPVALGAFAASLSSPSSTIMRPNLTPVLFQTVSSGVALIKTFTCSGRALGQGSGFLVGESVVMTARHVLTGACRARILLGREAIPASHWVFWKSSEQTADLAVIKLTRASTGHIFRFRTSPPPFGTNLAMVGHPLGSRLSLNQGKIVRRFKLRNVPIVAVRMLGAIGASGSAFIDDQARVVGILQRGLGRGEASGVLLGVELSTAAGAADW